MIYLTFLESPNSEYFVKNLRTASSCPVLVGEGVALIAGVVLAPCQLWSTLWRLIKELNTTIASHTLKATRRSLLWDKPPHQECETNAEERNLEWKGANSKPDKR